MAAQAHAASYYLWEGFERELNWAADTEEAATDRILDDKLFTEGSRSLRLPFKSSGPGARAELERKEKLDWSPYGALLVDVYVPEGVTTARLFLVLETTDRELKHECVTGLLSPGWNRDVRIDLRAPSFSTAASGWQPRGYLVGRGEVKEVKIGVYPGTALDSFVCLDNMRLERAGLVDLGSFSLNASVDGTASWGDIDFVPPGLKLRSRDLTAIEGFETGGMWTPWADGMGAERVSSPRSQGGSALAVTFPAAPEGVDIGLDGLELRLAGARQLRMDIYNPGRSVSAALTLEDADSNTYTSKRVTLAHGWNTPVFDFTNPKSWEGGTVTDAVLRNLASVSMNVSSLVPGKLVFDGISSGAVSLRGAARGGIMGRASWHPNDDLEFRADIRGEDTYYGSRLSDVHGAGGEVFADAASLRADVAGTRSRLLYRTRVTAFDQPIVSLVSPDNLGRDIAAFETAGQALGLDIQGLAAGRLEYGRYNRLQPTRIGPESLLGLHLKHRFSESFSIGATHVSHLEDYHPALEGVPKTRRTWGTDVEGRFAAGPVATSWALEGAMTEGDKEPPSPGSIVSGDDRYYGGVSLSPEWDRLSLYGSYTLLGYDFDAAFSKKGGNAETLSGGATVSLEELPPSLALNAIPIYDRSLGRNLSLGISAWQIRSRDRMVNEDTGAEEPRYRGYEAEVGIENDYTSKPNFEVKVAAVNSLDPWYRTDSQDVSLSLRVPLIPGLTADLSGNASEAWTRDKTTLESGTSRTTSVSAGLDQYFSFNLFVYFKASRSRTTEIWEGVKEKPPANVGWTAGARQVIGASTEIRLDYGQPPLYASGWEVQRTPNIFTLAVQSYF